MTQWTSEMYKYRQFMLTYFGNKVTKTPWRKEMKLWLEL